MATHYKLWDFAASAEGWTVGGGGSNVWGAGYGDGDGGFYYPCVSSGGGCSNSCIQNASTVLCTYWEGTFEDMGIPAGSVITQGLITDGSNTTHTRAKAFADANTRYLPRLGHVYYESLFGWIEMWQPFSNKVNSASWSNYSAITDSASGWSLDSDTNMRICIGHQASIRAKSLGTAHLYFDEMGIVFQYTPPATSMKDPIQAGIIPFAR